MQNKIAIQATSPILRASDRRENFRNLLLVQVPFTKGVAKQDDLRAFSDL